MAPAPARKEEEEREEEEEEEEIREREDEEETEEVAPGTHLPFAPTTSELFDMSTTVDPSYIISLIRKLLPLDARTKDLNLGNKTEAVETPDDLETIQILSDVYAKEVEQQFLEPNNFPVSTAGASINPESGRNEELGGSDDRSDLHRLSATEDPWEECGCILWDLSVNESHAKFMVDNLILEVLLASITVSKSARVTEICLGIIGNLTCHDVLNSTIISCDGLVETVVNQLFLDDTTCLSETCRLLTVGLQGSEFASWAKALQTDHILPRILWIAENTLNSQLLEKSIELLSAIVENQEVVPILLPSLIKLGLPNLLVSLLACEMSKITDESKQARFSILDLILRLIEALSSNDSYSQAISSNEELFQLVCGLVKLPDKVEVASSCTTAVVIIANILTDESHLALEMSQDFPFLNGLFDIFPFVSEDLHTRNALWCILARLFVQFKENNLSVSTLQQYASILMDKAYLIEEDLEGASGHTLNATTTTLSRIVSILEFWIIKRPATLEKDAPRDDGNDDRKVHRLLNYCRKYRT